MVQLTLPARPYCANTFRNTKIRSAEDALTHAYIQLNQTRVAIRYLIFDVDREGAAFAWEDARLPPPSFATVNPENAHAHLVWELDNPVWISEKSRERPQALLKAVRDAYTLALGADPGFTGLLTKNPNHPRWRTITFAKRKYSLNELAVECPVPIAFGPVRPGAPVPIAPDPDSERLTLGRNCKAFELGRFYAYDSVKKAAGFEAFERDVDAHLRGINAGFEVKLAERELSHIILHLVDWTWKHRHSLGRKDRDEGAMGFDPMRGLSHEAYMRETRVRQVAGGRYAGARRRLSTINALRSAMIEARLNGKQVTQLTVATISKRSISTVKRHWSFFFGQGFNQSIQFTALDRQDISDGEILRTGDSFPVSDRRIKGTKRRARGSPGEEPDG